MKVRWRSHVLVVGLGVVVLVAAVAAVLWFGGFLDGQPRRVPDRPDASQLGLSQPEADRLAAGLVNPDPARVAGVLSREAAAAYLAAPAPVIPPGSALVLDASSFTVTGEVDAVLSGSLTAGAQVTDVVLLLALEEDEWRVLTSVTA